MFTGFRWKPEQGGDAGVRRQAGAAGVGLRAPWGGRPRTLPAVCVVLVWGRQPGSLVPGSSVSHTVKFPSSGGVGQGSEDGVAEAVGLGR